MLYLPGEFLATRMVRVYMAMFGEQPHIKLSTALDCEVLTMFNMNLCDCRIHYGDKAVTIEYLCHYHRKEETND